MMLTSRLQNKSEWVLVGPMGPQLPESLQGFPKIGVDGGAHFATSLDIWVGDADSYAEKVSAEDIFKLPVDKDQSDLVAALNLFKNPRHYKFHLWGFLGGRRDHELFNLGESMTFLERHQESQMLFYNKEGKLTFHLLGAGIWKFQHSGTFSLGCLKKTEVKMTGSLKFPIAQTVPLYPLSSLGLSNYAEGEIVLENSGPVFLFFPEET